jgi:hypothetical protein
MTVFGSMDAANQWIEWDFKSADIEPTHYSIRTHGGPSGGGHLREWVLEGRTGDEGWTVLDERRNDSQLNGVSLSATFEITSLLRVRSLRLRQTGFNHRGTMLSPFWLSRFSGFCIAELGERECLNQTEPTFRDYFCGDGALADSQASQSERNGIAMNERFRIYCFAQRIFGRC